jgi:hypothetical protein
VAYTWAAPSLLPQVLPWLAVLVLLMLKPNRTARAWWIWAPLACVAGIDAGLRPALEFIPSGVLRIFCHTFNSLAFGIAAAWLLAPYLQNRLRFFVFLKMLLTVAVMSAGAYLVRLDWEELGIALGFLVFVGLCVLVAVAALSLAGLVCRRQYRPVRLTLWLVVLVAALWVLISAPFFLFAVLIQGGPGLDFVQAVLTFVVLTFVGLLPFLALAFANGLYRERLKQLLRLEGPEVPPVIPPITAPTPAA